MRLKIQRDGESWKKFRILGGSKQGLRFFLEEKFLVMKITVVEYKPISHDPNGPAYGDNYFSKDAPTKICSGLNYHI